MGALDRIADMETTVGVAAVLVWPRIHPSNAQIAFALCGANDADAVESVVTPLRSQLECWKCKKTTKAVALPGLGCWEGGKSTTAATLPGCSGGKKAAHAMGIEAEPTMEPVTLATSARKTTNAAGLLPHWGLELATRWRRWHCRVLTDLC